jgi:non-ribosomal peptide synthetase-like protein
MVEQFIKSWAASAGEVSPCTTRRRAPLALKRWPAGNSPADVIFHSNYARNDRMGDNLCLHHLFERQVDETPEALAIICREVTLTYEQLDHISNQLARHLRSLGVGPGKLIGVYLERSQNHIIAVLAILKAGAGYVPLDPTYPTERMKHILTDAEVGVLVTEQALLEQASGFFQHTLVLVDSHQEEITKQPTMRISPRETGLQPTDLCYIIYTSGTTGRPKGIMTEHRNAVKFVEAFTEVCRLDNTDRVYQGFSLGFDGSVEEIWMAFSAGATLVVGTPEVVRFGNEVAKLLTEKKVTFFSTVPTFLSMIKADLPTVRLIVVSGEQCPAELVERWARPNRRMLNVYGPTETTVNTTAAECLPDKTVTIGRPLRGYEIYILDGEMTHVPSGKPGELYIGGTTLARGYLNQPELTAKHFVANPFDKAGNSPRLYRTGDLVSLEHHGELQFHGRIDTQVKIRGFRIELSEIESVLREHPLIQAAVVKVFQRSGLEELAAFVVVDESGDSLDRDDLLSLLRQRLPPHMIPGYLELIEEIPTLPSGKVDRKRLPEAKTPLVQTKRDIVAPATELEKRILTVWEEIFKISPISTADDFFLDLGGYSLLAAQVVSRLRNECKLDVAIRDIYQYSTISKLAQELTAHGDDPVQAMPEQKSDVRRSSKAVFETIPSVTRWCVTGLQAIATCALYALMASPLLIALVMVLSVTDGKLALEPAIWIIVAMIFAAYPMVIAMSIILKWVIIGRYQPGEYPVWGFYYFRWWLTTRIQSINGISLFSGTPVMSLYFRLMGAKVGKNCIIDTPFCTIHDLVSIGNDTSICAESQLLGYQVRQGMLVLGTIEIGDRCFIGTHCAIGLNTKMGDDARLDDLSSLPDSHVMEAATACRGSPPQPADVSLPELPDEHYQRHPLLFGFIHLVLAAAVGVLLVLTMLPSLAIITFSLFLGGLAWGAVSLFLALPVGRVWFCFAVAILKKIILRRMKPGVYPVESTLFLRKWVVDALLNIGRNLLYTMYTTIYLPPWLRLLGARIGPRAEISTVSQLTPDLIDIGEESFFADGSMIGGRRFFRGHAVFAENRIGCRSFVGNSAMLPVGANLGDNCLIGVLSTPPSEFNTTPDGTEWLGSPAFRLAHRQKAVGFDDSEVYRPTKSLYIQRYIIDALRILIPSFIGALGLLAFVIFVAFSYWYVPLWVMLAVAPLVASGVAIGVALCIVPLKNLLMGRFKPVIKPLWSRYVWWNEVVNGAYESIGAPVLAPLMGTPFFSWYLRLLGCKVGKHVFLETALFSEFDLVEIGDYTALNLGVVVQNHLFEDRIMKSSYLRIGDECSVGNMSVVLYDTTMQQGAVIGPLSLLMKGETLAPFTSWLGIPTSQVGAQRAPDASQRTEIQQLGTTNQSACTEGSH